MKLRIQPTKIGKPSIGALVYLVALRPSRSLGWRILLLASTMLTIECGCKPTARNPVTQTPPIRVATFYWPGTYWVEIAANKGWFQEAGLNVQVVDCNADYFGSEKDLAEGRLDVNIFALFDLLDYVGRGYVLVGIVSADYSAGAEKLISRPEIDQVAKLKGRKIALPKNSYLSYDLKVAIGRAGLAPQDVQIVDTQPEKAPEALIKGEVDAMLTFEPYATQGLEAIKGHNLFDTSQVPGLSPTLIVFQRKFIEERQSEVTAFVGVWHRTSEFIREHPEEAYGIVALVNNKTVGEVRQFAKIDKILDLRDNELAFSFAAGLDSLPGAVRQMNDFMIAKGITDKNLDSSTFLDGSFIRALK